MSLFSKLNQVKDLREQAKQMQNTLSQEIVEIENHGIKVKMDGNQNVLSVNIPDGMEKESLEKYFVVAKSRKVEILGFSEHAYEFKDSRIVRVTPITKEICDMICNEIDKINYG